MTRLFSLGLNKVKGHNLALLLCRVTALQSIPESLKWKEMSLFVDSFLWTERALCNAMIWKK